MGGRRIISLGGLLVLLSVSPAAAQILGSEPPLLVVPPPQVEDLAVLSDEDLADDEQSGKGAVSLTDQDLTAVNTGNTINAGTVGSGAISMSDAALAGFNGIGNFTFNTGHNNNLQSSLSVTVIVTP